MTEVEKWYPWPKRTLLCDQTLSNIKYQNVVQKRTENSKSRSSVVNSVTKFKFARLSMSLERFAITSLINRANADFLRILGQPRYTQR